MLPTVNVLIPSYNRPVELDQAIESALLIEYENLSIIVSDDNSTISIDAVCEKYKHNQKVRFFKNTTNIGRVANYNKLLYELADAEWLINLDGDDYFISKSFIKDWLSNLHKKDFESVVFFMGCKSVLINEDLKLPRLFWENSKREYTIYEGIEYLTKVINVTNNFSHSAILYKRNKANLQPLYSFDSLNTDFHSFLLLALEGKIALMNESVYAWRLHEANSSKQFDFDFNKSKEFKAMLDVKSVVTNKFGKNQAKKFHRASVEIFYRGFLNILLKQKKWRLIFKDLFKNRQYLFVKAKTIFKIIGEKYI